LYSHHYQERVSRTGIEAEDFEDTRAERYSVFILKSKVSLLSFDGSLRVYWFGIYRCEVCPLWATKGTAPHL